MKILIETIPHDKQRYPTVGDWESTDPPGSGDSQLRIRVSETGDWKYNALIAVHELVEALLCKSAGISGEQVDQFDKTFLARSGPGPLEPGDDPNAPYHIQHSIATTMENVLAGWLGVNILSYEQRVKEVYSSFSRKPPHKAQTGLCPCCNGYGRVSYSQGNAFFISGFDPVNKTIPCHNCYKTPGQTFLRLGGTPCFHTFIETSSSDQARRGLHYYKCSHCPATRFVDSSD